MLVTVLFDGVQDPEAAEVRAFYRAVREAVGAGIAAARRFGTLVVGEVTTRTEGVEVLASNGALHRELAEKYRNPVMILGDGLIGRQDDRLAVQLFGKRLD